MIHEKGDLRDASPILLLFRVHERGLTGILHLRQDETQKVLYFHRGRFTWAISNAAVDRLETVLIQGGRCTREAVEALGSLPTGEHVGKALVEAGVVTLEELIAGSRDQLKGIVASVLFWNRGSYQFTLDPPPEKIVSLDLEIPVLVWEILSSGAPMDPIWKVIGSLQIELVADAERAASGLYTLPSHLKATLERFSTPARLETAIARLAHEEKMPVVQAVYFLLAAGLLKRTDSPPPPPVRAVEKTAEAVESEFAARYYSAEGHDESAPPPSAPLDEENMVPSSPRRPLALLVILALLLGGLLFLALRQFLRPPHVGGDPLPPARQTSARRTPRPVVPVAEGRDKASLPAVPASDTASPPKADNPLPQSPEPQPSASLPTPPATTVTTPPAQATVKTPLALFQAGDYPAAARGWASALRGKGKRYAVLLEMICDPRWIREAYDLLPQKEDFFILEKTRTGRACYVIFFGAASSEAEARARLAALPQTLWNRRDPPEIVELARYF